LRDHEAACWTPCTSPDDDLDLERSWLHGVSAVNHDRAMTPYPHRRGCVLALAPGAASSGGCGG
jgi:hypothetical protein